MRVHATAHKLLQTAVYWAPDSPSYDGFGRPVVDNPPVEIACRWVPVTEEFVDAQGTTRLSRAVVFAKQDLAVGGKLFLGTLDDLSSAQTPTADAWEILAVEKTSTLPVDDYVRMVRL